MAVLAAKPPQPLSSLRRGLYQAVADPDLAERVLTLAVASRSARGEVMLPWSDAMAPRTDSGEIDCPAICHLAHDLCVFLAFVPAAEVDRARELIAPAHWQLVTILGGWAALHAIPRHRRRRHIAGELARLRAPGYPLEQVPACERPRAAGQAEARAMLERFQLSFSALSPLDVFDLIAQPLTLGAIYFLLGRLAAVSERWAPERVRRTWYILAAKCPTASGD